MKRTKLVLLVCLISSIAWTLSAQIKITATGTGNTTGHVANLTIDNKGKSPIEINEQTAFIPSEGQYQPYIVTIPRTTLPPGTTTIPLPGYCADVTTPPVPTGDGMPPVDDWIATTPVTRPGPGTVPVDIVEQTVPRFTIESIPGITISTGYTPKPPPAIPGVGLTWPGTDIIVGGVLDPDTDPKSTAPVLIEALQNIANAYDKLRGEGVITTPFSGDPPRERESVIQQTFWFYAAGISGKRYQKEDFNNRVIEQYERNVGIAVSKIPESERNKLDEGVDAFWKTFTAVGVEAKVLQAAESTTITPATTTLDQTKPNSNDPPMLIKDKGKGHECSCDTMEITYTLEIGENEDKEEIVNPNKTQTAKFKTKKDTKVTLKDITVSASNIKEGIEIEYTVSSKLKCKCSDGSKCKELDGVREVKVEHDGTTVPGKKFTLTKLPNDITITVTDTCGETNCKQITCTSIITITIDFKADENKDEKK